MFPEMQARHQGFAVGAGRVQTDAFRHKMFEAGEQINLSAHELALRSLPAGRRTCRQPKPGSGSRAPEAASHFGQR
jgi:hypothetical protein